MQYLEFTSINPTFNLALEEAIFETLAPNHPGYFLLWQNAPSVIIGRHQITHEVVNSLNVEKYATPVLRRNSGGGAVYHEVEILISVLSKIFHHVSSQICHIICKKSRLLSPNLVLFQL